METAPLLGDTEVSNGQKIADYAPVKSFKELRSVVWKETVNTCRIAGPVVFQIICQFSVNTITTIFVGHLGELQLSGVSIAVSVVGSFSFGFMYGMGSATETLCGQAFGAGNIDMLSVYMQRAWIIMFICSIIITPIYIFASPILKGIGQADDVADLAGRFCILTIPQLISFSLTFPTQKFLQAQSKVGTLAWIALVALLLHALMLWLFVYEFGWGITGAAVAMDITSWGISIAQVIYIIGWCKDTWHGLSWLAFRDLWGFLKLSLSSAVMLCLEVWYNTSIIILTGHLKNAVIAVDSLSVCLNLNGLETILFIGVNAAMSVRVSNELGKRRPRAAKYSVYVSVTESFVLGLILMTVIILVKDDFAVIFTSSKVVQHNVAKLAYLLGITFVLNSVQPVISGVAIGAGWQTLVAYINLGCYYIFGLPLGAILCYVAHLGVQGLWGGMICGTAMQTLLLLIVLYRTNWNKEAEETTQRMEKWGGEDISKQKIEHDTDIVQ